MPNSKPSDRNNFTNHVDHIKLTMMCRNKNFIVNALSDKLLYKI